MKAPLHLLFAFLFLACSKKEDDSSSFLCEVDYVQFIDATSARVNFVVTHQDQQKNYLVNNTYSQKGQNFTVGEDLVRIENFVQKGNEATFEFYFGENLGPYCTTLFDAVPPHQHDPFNAEAELDTSAKGIGKWKIKKKRVISPAN